MACSLVPGSGRRGGYGLDAWRRGAAETDPPARMKRTETSNIGFPRHSRLTSLRTSRERRYCFSVVQILRAACPVMPALLTTNAKPGVRHMLRICFPRAADHGMG